MTSVAVLDASAMIAFAKQELGYDVVMDILTDPAFHCHAHVVNVCEVYYDYLRVYGQSVADKIVRDFEDAGVTFHEDMDRTFWRQIGQNKASFTLALGDCFCLALAQHLGGEVVTSDHQFDPVDAQGVCPVRFIR